MPGPMQLFDLSQLWEALKGDLAAGRDAFVGNMDRAMGRAPLAEGETDSGSQAQGGMALAGTAMTGSMPASAPAGALRAGAGLFDMARNGRLPDVPQAPIARYEPPRGPRARSADVLSDPKVKRGTERAIDAGLKEGGADWYWTEPLRQRYVDALGPEQGNKLFGDFMHYVAATSPQSKVPINIRIASYYDNLARNDQPFAMPKKGSGFGSKGQNLHLQNAENYRAGSWDPLENPKPISFAQNLTGNWAPATIDTHAVRLPTMLSRDPRWLATNVREGSREKGFTNVKPQALYQAGDLSIDEAVKRPGFWGSVPRDNEYGIFEQFYSDFARKKGLTPAEVQAAAWLGGRKLTGMDSPPAPFLSVFDMVLDKAAKRQGADPQKLLDQFILGRATLR